MGDYLKYTITAKDEVQAEIITCELADLGFESFSEYDSKAKTVDAFIQLSLHTDGVVGYLSSLEDVSFDCEVVEQQNWNELWESNFSPIEVGTDCYIRAHFHPEKPEFTHEIVITPKMSFGTGHHPTTHLMVESILRGNLEELSGLDMGSGTGILAILAAKVGAKSVDAIDIDEWAYENGSENIANNGVSQQVNPQLGDASAIDSSARYDFVLANINRNILLADMHIYGQHMVDGGVLIMSGFLEIDCDSLIERARTLQLEHRATYTRDGWACMEFVKLRGMKLRSPQMSDLDLLLKWENDPAVQEFGSDAQEYTLEDMRDFIERDDNLVVDGQQRLMIECGAEVVGCIDFYDFDIEARSAYVGILIYEGRGRGYGSQALSLFADYARKVYHLRCLFAVVPSSNGSALALFNKSGYEQIEGDTYRLDL
ncbi:MAG: 50S ribosomal protein L11 methyltransferase [Rikenellaceae bacterium]